MWQFQKCCPDKQFHDHKVFVPLIFGQGKGEGSFGTGMARTPDKKKFTCSGAAVSRRCKGLAVSLAGQVNPKGKRNSV